MCCCGGCLSGYRSRRWRLATPRPRARRAAVPLRREPTASPAERRPEPRRPRLGGRHAPHRPIPSRDMRARPRVPDTHTPSPRPRHNPGKPPARRTLNSSASSSRVGEPPLSRRERRGWVRRVAVRRVEPPPVQAARGFCSLSVSLSRHSVRHHPDSLMHAPSLHAVYVRRGRGFSPLADP